MWTFIGRFAERSVHVVDKKRSDGVRESYLKDDVPDQITYETSRLVDRGGQFHQSEGEMSIKRKVLIEDVMGLFYAGDPVLFLVNMRTLNCCFMLLTIYITGTLIMSIPWYILGLSNHYYDRCNVDTTSFSKAYVFSLEIMMTIGFGAKDIYFGGCGLPIFILTVNSCLSLILQAAVMGVLYQRISRNRSRRKTVVMSNKAVIRRIRNKLYFMFQICELRKRQLVEATVRLYTVRYEQLAIEMGVLPEGVRSGRFGPTMCQTYTMRLSHPNDDLGSKLLLSTPQVVVHEIDDFSPLLPPPGWVPSFASTSTSTFRQSVNESGLKRHHSAFGVELGSSTQTPFSTSLNEIYEWDKIASTNDDNGLPTAPTTVSRRCQYTFPSVVQRRTGKNGTDNNNNYNYNNENDVESQASPEVQMIEHMDEKRDITQFMQETRLEVVVLIEGVDPLTSHTVQAFHSYKAEDIEWDHFFAPCTLLDKDGWTIVDFTKFHKVYPVPTDSYSVRSPSHC